MSKAIAAANVSPESVEVERSGSRRRARLFLLIYVNLCEFRLSNFQSINFCDIFCSNQNGFKY